MTIGVPREIKADEYRVSLLPVGAEILTRGGHTVLVQETAGLASGFPDDAYVAAGASIVATAEEIWSRADLIVKVKEPQAQEWPLMRPGQIVFTYFHFAADAKLTRACLDRRITAVAYETITDREGRLPLLAPMSEIAGKMSAQQAAKYLEKPMSGAGILLGGVPGVAPATALVLGGGIVGANAAKVLAGLGANVIILDINLDRLRYLAEIMPANVQTVYSDPHTVQRYLPQASAVIGAVLIPGARAPRLVRREQLRLMRPGSVIVDVAIDQGGCVETSRPTTHHEPTYKVDGVVHYCVTNIPGAVCQTSSVALCNATFPYLTRIAEAGLREAAAHDVGIQTGINTLDGALTNRAVAEALGIQYTPLTH